LTRNVSITEEGLEFQEEDLRFSDKVVLYILTSYLYYIKDISLISDSLFDKICRDLLQDYQKIYHYHASFQKLVDKSLLQAGSGFKIKFKYMPFWLQEHATFLEKKFELKL